MILYTHTHTHKTFTELVDSLERESHNLEKIEEREGLYSKSDIYSLNRPLFICTAKVRKGKSVKDTIGISGITLIALVITIVVLLILASISITAVFGDNGLISMAEEAKEEETHAEVKDGINTAYFGYITGKMTNKEDNFINYLQKKGIISETETNGGYKINVEKLLGSKLGLGNGEEQDVYKLEEVTGEEKTYKIKYYGEREKELGTLKDNIVTEEPNVENPEIHKLKVGDYISIPYKGSSIKCVVLYDDAYNTEHTTDYGIQIMALDKVGEEITFGRKTEWDMEETEKQLALAKCQEDYNNAITTLNNKADEVLKEVDCSLLKEARSLGTVPSEPNSMGEIEYVEGDFSGYFRETDSNYFEDLAQINKNSLMELLFSTCNNRLIRIRFLLL